MLCVTRKKNETICIGDAVQVMVVAIGGDKVRLGVSAPRSVEVDRGEVRLDKLAKRGESVGESGFEN